MVIFVMERYVQFYYVTKKCFFTLIAQLSLEQGSSQNFINNLTVIAI